jgi:hypothetical protein
LLRKFIPAVAALAIALTGGAHAVADDYVFEPFRAEIKASIIHRNATKKPIVNAVIIHTHGGRGEMSADSGEPAVAVAVR